MAHVMKHTKASCGHMFAHFDRKAANISNENLDRTRTHLNYNIATHQQMDQGEFVRQRCSEVRCQNRKDVNVMCSWVVTAPKDLPEHEHKYFFKATYDFLEKRYGKENVVSAYVHLDEVTPHMHFAFVPVTYDKDKERYKVSAKEVVSRNDLKTFHSELEGHLERSLGHKVNILNEATKNGNKTVSELKRQSCLEVVREAEKEALLARKMASSEQAKLDGLISQKTALMDDINRLTTERDVLSEAEVEAIKGEKNLLGGLKGVTYKEFEALKRTATAVEDMAAERDEALSRAKDSEYRISIAEARASKAYADANNKLREKIQEVERDRPSLKMQQENIRLQRENDSLRRELDKYQTITKDLAEIVRNRLPEVYESIIRGGEQKERNKSKSHEDTLDK